MVDVYWGDDADVTPEDGDVQFEGASSSSSLTKSSSSSSSQSSYSVQGDVFEETFETFPGYDETWNGGEYVDPNCDLLEDHECSLVTGAPNWWGDYCLRSIFDSGGSAAVRHTFGGGGLEKVFFRVELVLESLGPISESMSFVLVRDVTGQDGVYSAQVRKDSAGDYHLDLYDYRDGEAVLAHTQQITLDTVYRIEFKWDLVAGTFEHRVDGVSKASGTVTSAIKWELMDVGAKVGGSTGILYLDNLEINDQAFPGAEPSSSSSSSNSSSLSETKTSSSSSSSSEVKSPSSSSSSLSATKTSSSSSSSSWSSYSISSPSVSSSSSSNETSPSSSSSSSIDSKSSSLISVSVSSVSSSSLTSSSSSSSLSSSSSSVSETKSSSSSRSSSSRFSWDQVVLTAPSGVTFGEFNASERWEGWRYEGSYEEVARTDQWGRIELGEGEAAVSQVIDLTNVDTKYLAVGLNLHQKGYGKYSVQWRGDYFNLWKQDDNEVDGPVWEAYAGGNKTWRWVQLKITALYSSRSSSSPSSSSSLSETKTSSSSSSSISNSITKCSTSSSSESVTKTSSSTSLSATKTSSSSSSLSVTKTSSSIDSKSSSSTSSSLSVTKTSSSSSSESSSADSKTSSSSSSSSSLSVTKTSSSSSSSSESVTKTSSSSSSSLSETKSSSSSSSSWSISQTSYSSSSSSWLQVIVFKNTIDAEWTDTDDAEFEGVVVSISSSLSVTKTSSSSSSLSVTKTSSSSSSSSVSITKTSSSSSESVTKTSSSSSLSVTKTSSSSSLSVTKTSSSSSSMSAVITFADTVDAEWTSTVDVEVEDKTE